jgi:putative endonuclease
MDPRQRLGRAGEDLVSNRLRSRGWRVIERNARTRYGELDLIAMTPDRRLVFVEVKTRRANSMRGPATPAESVGPAKARRIRRLAAAWLQANPGIGASAIRFDVAGVEVAANGAGRLVQYIEAAF